MTTSKHTPYQAKRSSGGGPAGRSRAEQLSFHFLVSIHYELFFALQTLTDPDARIHPEWKKAATAALPESFHRRFQTLGAAPFLWPCIADVLQAEPACTQFEALIHELGRVALLDFQQRILLGAIHDPKLVDAMLAGKKSLFDAISGVQRTKREWLIFIGLYPYTKDAAIVRALEWLLRAPEEFRKEIVYLIKTFWSSSFEQTWLQLQPQLKRSVDEKERLFRSSSFEEFARVSLLRVEVNERERYLKAVRGGFRLRFDSLADAYFFPSCFNDRRHWTCYSSASGMTTACFPYFDPAISLEAGATPFRTNLIQPELDAALIFAALGDSTRFAIASLIARTATSAADLGRTLSLSPATVSHHIHVLREAGLLQEVREGKSLCLSLNREVIEAISALAVQKLFASTSTIEIKKTRNK